MDCSVAGLPAGFEAAGVRCREKGFLPCLISFAVMDFVVIPKLRRRWER